MKIRRDFVTNSSSSSFVCEICGASDGGWDMTLEDAEMAECLNGHTFCSDHLLCITQDEKVRTLTDFGLEKYLNSAEYPLETDYDFYHLLFVKSGFRYNVPEELCPICSFVEYSESDLANYLLKKYGVSTDEVFALVKQTNRRRKKLYDSEYITEVCKRFNLSPADIVAGWKDEFQTYRSFKGYIR